MRVAISFGAVAPSIATQIESAALRANAKDIAHFQKDADAITRLYVRGLLTEGETHRARQRLMKKIVTAVSHPIQQS